MLTCTMLSVRRMSPQPSRINASMPPGPKFTLQSHKHSYIACMHVFSLLQGSSSSAHSNPEVKHAIAGYAGLCL